MAGFSDGASYSLSIGLANGDLFAAVFGFSPGFVFPATHIGKPPVIHLPRHHRQRVLPIDSCSRRIVPQLKSEGYRVTYREFEGKTHIASGHRSRSHALVHVSGVARYLFKYLS